MATFNLSSQVKIVNPVANIDSMYGPYGSTADACNQTTGVPTSLRANGRTVGITTIDGVVEYWWKNGTTDGDLVIKVEEILWGLQEVVDVGNSWNNIRFVNSQESYFSVLNLASESSEYLYFTDNTYSTYIGNTSVKLGSVSVLTNDNGIAKLASINADSGLILKTNSNNSSNAVGFIKTDNISSQVTLQFPTNSGTIALASDIPPALGYTPVDKAGDTMVGDLILNRDPETALGAVTKQYVDNVTVGINFHAPVHAATTLNLGATYSNGIGGVGATLTATSFGALVVDSQIVEYLQRVLVWQQNDPKHNGIYDLTTVGDVDTYWQLTRSSDADNSPAGEMSYGDFTFVQQGDTYGGFGFICNTAGAIDIGTTSISYVQFNAAQAVTAGNGLQEISTNVLEIDTAIVQEKITLGTTGSTGPATFIDNVLNIPQPVVPGLQQVLDVGSYAYTNDGLTISKIAISEYTEIKGGQLEFRDGSGHFSTLISGGVGYFKFPSKTRDVFTLATLDDIPSISGVGGSGTISYIPKFTGTSAIGDSSIFDTGSTVSISGKLIVSANGVYATKTGWGNFTTAFGYQALNNSTGERNTAFGYRACSSNTSASYNTAFGQFALFSNLLTAENTAIGSGALSFITTGSGRNTAIGRNAGSGATSNLTDISESIFIGYLSRPGANSQTNQIVIGNDLAGSGSNTVTIGNNSITSTILKGLITAPLTTNSLIEADTTGKAVTTKEYVNNRLVVETTAGYTLTDADSGGIVIFKTTAAQTLTIPTGLAAGFECTFVTLAGVTLTVSAAGITLNNNTSTVLLPQLSFTLKRMIATDTYIAIGNL